MDIGIPELLIILVVVLLLFGPGRIARSAGELGAALREFRKGLKEDHASMPEASPPQASDPAKRE